jgi:diguanylate cyclase (GGDEF)-like protein
MNTIERNIYYQEELLYSYRRLLTFAGLFLLSSFLYYCYQQTIYGTCFLEASFWIILLGISALMHYYFLHKYPYAFSVARKIIPMALDISVLTIIFIRFGDHGIFLLPLYMLVVMRIGLSYGKPYFYVSLMMVLLSWTVTYQVSPYWQVHYDFLATFAGTTFLIPFIYLNYIEHIHDERQELNHILQDVSHHINLDPLTGAYNRNSYKKVCDYLIKENIPFALLYIDMNNFKRINDRYGHHVGDLVLKEMTRKLKSLLGKHDLLARLGGDEFAILLSRKQHSVKKMIWSIEEEVMGVYILEGYKLPVSLSIGISLYPEDGHSTAILSAYADQAMYHAKNSERTHHCFYNDIKSSSCALKEKEASNGR